MASESVKHGHYSFQIFFRHGRSIGIDGTINAANGRSKQYITDISVRRSIGASASLTFTIRDLSRSDSLFLQLKALFTLGEKQLFPDDSDVTWKQMLEPGNVVKISVNGEYRGTFLVSSMRRVTNERATGYSVSCIGLQEWLMRQSVHFDVGAEALYLLKNKLNKSKYLENFPKFVPPSEIPESSSPAGGITLIINKIMNGFMDSIYGSYKFNDGSTIQDMIGLALSPVSYFGTNTQLVSRIGSIKTESGFSIWDAIMQYQAAPFHELWVTTGARIISLYNIRFKGVPWAEGKERAATLAGLTNLKDDKEYIVFRPTPYDHPLINDAEVDQIPGKNGTPRVITTKMLNDYSLHNVDATTANFGIGADSIISQQIHVSDDNLYSTYKVHSALAKLSGSTADTLYPPIVDYEAMRQVGRRVFSASLEGLNVSKNLKTILPEDHTTSVEFMRILQAKAYNWFKYNGRFNKGQLTIQWMPNIHEGMHVPITSLYPDEDGIYYINGYELQITHNDMFYTLDLTRGFPYSGFKKTATDFVDKKESSITAPAPKTTTDSNKNKPPVTGGVKKDNVRTGTGGGTGGRKRGAGRSGGGGGSYITLTNTSTNKSIVIKINDTNGDVYDASTNRKLGNIKTWEPYSILNSTPATTTTPVGSQTERYNDARLKFGYKPSWRNKK